MVSAPNSPVKSDDKENIVQKLNGVKALSRRHSLAPSKSILKNTNLRALNESDLNHTISVMQDLPSRDHTVISNRRVSFAPEVTLHKIDMIPQLSEPSPQRQPRRRETLRFVPPVRTNDDEFEDRVDQESSDMDVDDGDQALSKSPFVIFQDDKSEEEEEEDDDNSEFNSLFDEEDEDMELATHHGMIQVDEMEKLKALKENDSNVEEMNMELTVHHGATSKEEWTAATLESLVTSGAVSEMEGAQDMEFTQHQGGALDRADNELILYEDGPSEVQDMELTMHQGNINSQIHNEEAEDMDLTIHQGNLNPQKENEEAEDMDLTIHQGNMNPQRENEEPEDMEVDLTPDEGGTVEHDDMELTIYKGKLVSDLKPQQYSEPPQEENVQQHDMILPHSPRSGLVTRKLSEIAEMTEPEDDEPVRKKNPLLEKVQAQSNFSFDSSEIEDHDVSEELTTTAFGDPSIFEDILRVTGGSQDEEEVEKDNSNQLPVSTKRVFATPKKSLTTEAGSPQERSSSLKKRKLSYQEEPKSPIFSSQLHREVKSPSLINLLPIDLPSTPLKNSSTFSSPEQPNLEEMIQSLTPNRTKKRESFGYVSQSPRRRSISEEVTLTPLRVAKEHKNEALNLQQAVITTTVPLAGNDDSQDMEDITDDYVPVELQTFLKCAGVKFYDDLNVRDSSDDLMLGSFEPEAPLVADYLSALQKLKNFELINFSCDELKKNINEGKKLFEALDQEIYEMNPPLIREYMEAEPQVQDTMNIQFQVLKNYARHQAKNVWYEWRSSLVEGVHQGLLQNKRLLEDNILKIKVKIEEVTKENLKLVEEFAGQKLKFEKLTKHKAEFDNCDKEELMLLRSKLISTSEQLSKRKDLFESLTAESNALLLELNNVTDKVNELNSDLDKINIEIKENQIFSKSDIKLMQLKFSVLERVTGLRLQKIESNSIEMMIDHIEIEYSSVENTVNFNFNKVTSPIMNKFQTALIDKSSSNQLENISSFLQRYKNLINIDKKFEKLRLYSNGVIKFIENDDSILVRIKEVNDSYKRIITFKIDSKFLEGQKIGLDDLSIDTVSYKDEAVVADDIDELKFLLHRLEIM